MYKVSDLEFQGHVIEIEILTIFIRFLDPENIPMNNFTKKFGQEDQNPGGVATTPPWLQTLVEIAWLYTG